MKCMFKASFSPCLVMHDVKYCLNSSFLCAF